MVVAVVLLPLIGAILGGLLAFASPHDKHAKHKVDQLAQAITCGALVLSMLAALVVFFDVAGGREPYVVTLFTWMDSGAFEVSWALRVDTLSAVMMAVVTVVSAMVHIYSIGYMHHDPSIPRFMAYLNFFTFAMFVLTVAAAEAAIGLAILVIYFRNRG
ncbi:MAG: hypothetical protein MUE49_10880, partial [Rhodospirillales bacterium]|nr:hypothetical protein [Rhodospirillales bacterium]